MQRHLLLLCFLICCATANAEKTDSINFLCKVADAFTGDYIKDGEVDILSTDSTFLCKGHSMLLTKFLASFFVKGSVGYRC